MNVDSIEVIICDQEMNADETTMFNILSSWVKKDEGNTEAGKRLASHIQLCYMKPDYLKYRVKNCGFVAPADVDSALKEIEDVLANEMPDDKEHVLVTGAGQEGVNGIYVRLEEDIGMGCEEVVFVKEGDFDTDYGEQYNLFLLRSTWAITLAVDCSNLLYSCEVTQGSILPRPPGSGWQSIRGRGPPPTCTWSPGKTEAGKPYVAPDISSCIAAASKRGDSFNGWDHSDGVPKKMSLLTMMALPVDEGHEEEDYSMSLTAQEDLQSVLSDAVPREGDGSRSAKRNPTGRETI